MDYQDLMYQLFVEMVNLINSKKDINLIIRIEKTRKKSKSFRLLGKKIKLGNKIDIFNFLIHNIEKLKRISCKNK